jgi:coenzyme F420-reducing hydrogenase delta subunit
MKRTASGTTTMGRSTRRNEATPRPAFNVVAFSCAASLNGSAPASLAGAPQDVQLRHIPVPCSGKLQPEHLLKAFEAGADMVVVLTCRDGDCRYLEGRRRIERRVDYVRGLLDQIGLGGRRLVLLDQSRDSPASDTWGTLAASRAGLTASPLGRKGAGEG